MNRDILSYLEDYPPRYAPEWGSGGIFGLKYYRGVLYYTVAFEAISRFIDRDRIVEYRYELVGGKPVSGGDTYNAVEAVDDKIYFGGWVHAPAIHTGRLGSGGTISFTNKYSHVHAYSIDEGRTELLWKESLHDEKKWVGEVSDIIYDPVNDRLLLARGDGHENLGIYALDRNTHRITRLAGKPVLKGAHFFDYVCFGAHSYPEGLEGIYCIDLVEDKTVYKDYSRKDIDSMSIDGDSVLMPQVGTAISSYSRFFLFTKGGVFIGNPVEESIEPMKFIRLFDFVENLYGPLRTMAKPFGGGILVAYNSYTHGFLHTGNPELYSRSKILNTIVGPSVLVYITPSTTKIVGAYGARITGFERIGDRLVIAVNNMANLGELDATPIDIGYRSFLIEPTDIVNRPPPPITYSVPGYLVDTNTFGGIPLTGYREPSMIVYASKENKLYINSYTIDLPTDNIIITRDVVDLKPGLNKISLEDYRGLIVSFKLRKTDDKASMKIILQ